MQTPGMNLAFDEEEAQVVIADSSAIFFDLIGAGRDSLFTPVPLRFSCLYLTEGRRPRGGRSA